MARWQLGPAHPAYGFVPGQTEEALRRPGMAGRQNAKLPPGRWSRAFAACVACGKTERKHAGHGYCFGCYFPNLKTIIALRTEENGDA